MKELSRQRELLTGILFGILFVFSAAKSHAQISLQLTPSSYNGFNISCFGENDGSLNLSIAGGIPPFTVVWSTGDSTEDLTNLTAGYYRVRVEDSDSVPNHGEAEITLTEPKQLKLTSSIHVYANGFTVSLFGACNGIVNLTASEGVAPYSWLWNDLNTNQNRNALCADRYEVVATDINGCKAAKEMVLKQPDRSDWQMNGNANTDPALNFIGTIDSTDVIIRTNNQEAVRIKANGDIIANKLQLSRIVPQDSIVYIGNNSIAFNDQSNNITGTPFTNTSNIYFGGLGLGYKSWGKGLRSTAIGYQSISNNDYGIAIGSFTRANATGAIVIGSGYNNGTANFVNTIPNSLMITLNSTLPTLFISPGGGSGSSSTGTAAICTTYVNPDYKLAVNGKIIATEVVIKNGTAWPDYVFSPAYEMMSLYELKVYINTNRHLPDIPSAEQIEKEGIATSEVVVKLVQKVEELTLHAIRQQEEIDDLKEQISHFRNR